MHQTFPSEGNGQLVGSVMVLQALTAQLLATHPEKERIMGSVAGFAAGIDDGAAEAANEGNTATFMFLSDISAGMTGTISMIREYLDAIEKTGGAHLDTSTTRD